MFDQLILEYKRCDLLAFVSTYEGFGLPILEAQAAGIPVLTSNLSSMPEVAGLGAVLVDPYSINEINRGVLSLINNETLRNRIVEYGFANVKKYVAKEISEQYINLYNDLINE